MVERRKPRRPTPLSDCRLLLIGGRIPHIVLLIDVCMNNAITGAEQTQHLCPQRSVAPICRRIDAGERIHPTIWPAPVLHEGDDLASDVLGVALPDPGSDLTVVIQT
jgi:hypothetical protein